MTIAPAPADRVAALDLIRGVAVLGILAVNIAGFAGPPASVLTPHIPVPGDIIDEAGFAAVFVVFEGKMRALFSLLFGAGMVLFIERAEAAGRNGDLLQFRRLGWLLVFGLAHYFLFWWGDILFLYALAGIVALFMRDMQPRALLIAALVIFAGWHLGGAASTLAGVQIEERVRLDEASLAESADQAAVATGFARQATEELASMKDGFVHQIVHKLRDTPFGPVETALSSIGETLPLVLIGMALYRLGFFAGGWSRKHYLLALGGGLAGLTMTLTLLQWLWARHFPPRAMTAALLYWTALPHLLIALAYAAMLIRHTPRLMRTTPGRRLADAGRMAFSNYIGTTLLMTAIFHGWGLGLAGSFGHARLGAFILLGWAAMLLLSHWWLARFRQGPLEWVWRSLVEKRSLPLKH